jgi:ABC-type transport system involved in multi-copper enzyme maturation permease subunit
MNLIALWKVFRFECGRTLTAPRLLTWLLLAGFPAGLLLLIQQQGGYLGRDERGGVALFVLIPEFVCIMGQLLWAAPVVYSELEGKTWTYLAVSPAGKASVLVGKYLTAVVWTALAAWFSLAMSLAIVRPESDALRLGVVLAALVPLSALAYGAVYLLLGVIFLRRAMVAAVAYTFISEVLISFVPALINQLTVQFHLRTLLVRWMDWENRAESLRTGSQFFSTAPAWQHILALLVFAALFLFAAVLVLRRRELVSPDQV